MVFSMLSSLLKPRVVVGGGSLLRIGSSTKKRTVLSILSASSSSLSSSSSSSLFSSYDQDHSSSSIPRNTYGLAALGLLIGSINNHDNDNNQTTHMAPSDESNGASFISSEMIGAAAKIFRYASPQQCTYGEALEYAGVPREFAVTGACASRLTRDIGIINAYHGAPLFEDTKDEFKRRYETIFRLIPCTVTIENKHNRLLRMIGLPLLPPPPVSIMVNGRKEFLPSISTINPKDGKKNPSAIAQHLGRKSKTWMREMMNESELAATTDAAVAAVISGNNNNVLDAATTLPVHLITERQEVISPITVNTMQGSFARMTLSSSSSSASALAPVSLLSTSASGLNSFEPPSSVSASAASAATSASASANLFEPSPLIADLVRQSDNTTNNFDDDDDDDLASLESGPLIEPTSKRHGQNTKSSQLITSLSSKGITRNTLQQEQAQRQEEERQKSNKILMHKLGSLLWKGSVEGETDLTRFDSADKCAGLMNRLFGYRGVSGYQLSNAVKQKRAGKPPPELGRPSIGSFLLGMQSINQMASSTMIEVRILVFLAVL